jgi:hypothetical protein
MCIAVIFLGIIGGTEVLLIYWLYCSLATENPELMKGLGQGIRGFKKAVNGEEDDDKKEQKK